MSRYITDTLALVLFLEKRKIHTGVKQIFQNAAFGVNQFTKTPPHPASNYSPLRTPGW